MQLFLSVDSRFEKKVDITQLSVGSGNARWVSPTNDLTDNQIPLLHPCEQISNQIPLCVPPCFFLWQDKCVTVTASDIIGFCMSLSSSLLSLSLCVCFFSSCRWVRLLLMSWLDRVASLLMCQPDVQKNSTEWFMKVQEHTCTHSLPPCREAQ